MTKAIFISRLQSIFIISGLLILYMLAPAAAQDRNYKPHGTYMGFSPWPPDMSLEAIERVYSFLKKNGNIIAHHFDSGVPWEEALAGSDFPEHLMAEWTSRKSRTPPGMPVYLAITPINFERTGLSLAWTERGDNQPLDDQWAGKRLDDPSVKHAFLNYARRAIAYFKPKYLAIGIEANIILSKNPQFWEDYLDLNKFVYTSLKREYPRVTVFSTVQYEHLRGIELESQKYSSRQVPGVRKLMRHSDLMALNTYKYGLHHANQMHNDYFELAESFGRTVAIAGTGAMSSPVMIAGTRMDASLQDQYNFISGLLAHATRNKYPFVINWIPIDFDPMLNKLPAWEKDIANAWVHNGLQENNGADKPALSIWKKYFSAYSKSKRGSF